MQRNAKKLAISGLLYESISYLLLTTFPPFFYFAGKQLDGIWYDSSFCYFDSWDLKDLLSLENIAFYVMFGSSCGLFLGPKQIDISKSVFYYKKETHLHSNSVHRGMSSPQSRMFFLKLFIHQLLLSY